MLKGTLEMPHLSVLGAGWVGLCVVKAFSVNQVKYYNKTQNLNLQDSYCSFLNLSFVKSWDFLISLYKDLTRPVTQINFVH